MDAKVIERVTKLLALAKDGGATEAEALLAMEKAEQIAKENNISIALIEMSGGQSEKRAKEEEKGNIKYPYQQALMKALCEVNYCHVSIKYREAKSRGFGSRGPRYIPGYYLIIGRESNVATVRVMFDYLIKTINRLVLAELKGDHTQRMSRWAMSWCDGCSDRLVHRLRKRHNEVLIAQKKEAEAQKKEQAARANHPGAAPATGNALVVVLMDHAQNEIDLNNDFRYGYEPGTTARQRAEAKAEADKLYKEAIAAGADKDVAWYMSHGYTREQAEKLAHPEKFETPEEREKRKRREEREDASWSRRERQKDMRRDWGGYSRGSDVGDTIGLDQQLDNATGRKLK